MKENDPHTEKRTEQGEFPAVPPAVFSEPPLPQVVTDEDLEDAFLEDALLALTAPPDLESRISGSLAEPEVGGFRYLRIAAVAAVFIVGLIAGLLVPLGNMPIEREAEAASLRNDVAAFSRGAKFISDEVGLLPELDPSLSATLFINQLHMSALPETGRSILAVLKSKSARDMLSTNEFSNFERFFSQAVGMIDVMKTLAEDGTLSSEDVSMIRRSAPSIQPPREISSMQIRIMPFVKSVRISDPALQPYMEAKRFIYIGDYDRAIPILEANRGTSPAQISQLMSYWLAKSYLASNNPSKASNEIGNLPYQLQMFFPTSVRSFTGFSSTRISIHIAEIPIKPFRSMHILNKPEGGTIAITIYLDGSVSVRDNGTETYPSIEHFRDARGDLYDGLFNLDKRE